MIRHILTRDLKQLWPFVVGAALLKAAEAAIIIHAGIFGGFDSLSAISPFIGIVHVAAVGFIVVLAVQADPLSAPNADWLVRPVKRHDLLLAKLTFVILAVGLPTFITELTVRLIQHLPLLMAFGAAAMNMIAAVVIIGLPAMAIGAVTSTWTEAAIAAFGLFIAWLSIFIARQVLHVSPLSDAVGWLGQVLEVAFILSAAALVLPLQYFRRTTTISRFLFAATFVLCAGALFLPNSIGFALLKATGPKSPDADHIQLAFDAAAGHYSPDEVLRNTNKYLPVRVTNLKPGTLMQLDHVTIRVAASDGHILAENSGFGWSGLRSIQNTIEGGSAPAAAIYQAVQLKPDMAALLENRQVRVTMVYELTALKPERATTLPIDGSPEYLRGFSTCAARWNGGLNGTVQLNCFDTPQRSTCVKIGIDGAAAPILPRTHCWNGYAPKLVQLARPSWIGRLTDGFNLSSTPEAIKSMRLTLNGYTPVAHITRVVTTPLLRLNDWKPDERGSKLSRSAIDADFH